MLHTAFAPPASCQDSWIRQWPSTRALGPATAAAPRSLRSAMPRFRCVAGWERHGTRSAASAPPLAPGDYVLALARPEDLALLDRVFGPRAERSSADERGLLGEFAFE